MEDRQRGYNPRHRGGRGGRPGFNKRRREEQQVLDPKSVLLSSLIYFGDDYMPVRGVCIVIERSAAILSHDWHMIVLIWLTVSAFYARRDCKLKRK